MAITRDHVVGEVPVEMVPTRSPELPKPFRTPGKSPKPVFIKSDACIKEIMKNLYDPYSLILNPTKGNSVVYRLPDVDEQSASSSLR